MAATTRERLTEFFGNVPARGTFPIAANTKVLKGTLVGLDSTGRVKPAGDGATTILGMTSANYSSLDGTTTDQDVEIEYGTFGWNNAPGELAVEASDVGSNCYVLDNQTVSKTGTVVAGVVVDVRNGAVRVWSGPFGYGG